MCRSLFLLILLFPTLAYSQCLGSTTYTATFTAMWTAQSHPKDFPAANAPHWSGIVGGSHNPSYSMWKPGGQATPGVKSVAEVGGQGTLEREMKAAGNNVLDIVKWSTLWSSTGTRSGDIDLDSTHTLVSLISMIAPSPDWFVGVHDLNLCNGSQWAQSVTVDLFLYDAGTDSGLKFTSANSPTSPQEPIFRFTGTNPNNMMSSFFGYNPVKRMGTFSFQLKTLTTPTTKITNTTMKKMPPMPTNPIIRADGTPTPMSSSPCTASGSPTYEITFNAMWTPQTHPDLYPSNAHWSRTVTASHNSKYVMWTRGGMATAGVKDVAELGKVDQLSEELSSQSQAGNVKDTDTASGIGDGVGTATATVTVDKDHSLLSTIAMIAPSPDWFVGIHDVSICNGNQWVKGPIKRSLRLYDAGTDSGLEFTSSNDRTIPPEPISLITSQTQGSFFGKDYEPFGDITIVMSSSSPGPTGGASRSATAGALGVLLSIVAALLWR